ncbi:hypothetical protein Vretimale_4735 [Volvox reticuliferus]|nr:hypothetical protein Vretifemale_3335 [Volvox reticuliferus]GIL99607.1 hypothetical protein Vretimale_4735 [Volvox reticuliferus]
MLLTANSTGELRLYRLPDLVQKCTAASAVSLLQSPEVSCSSSWLAHQGPAYCLTKAQAGTDLMVLSGGDDGYVRGWRLSDVMRHMQIREPQKVGSGASGTMQCAQPGQQQPQNVLEGQGKEASQARPTAFLAARLPRAESPMAASSLPPAVQALARSMNGSNTVVFAGCSDGGVYCLDLSSGTVSRPSGAGHVAAVLAMDLHEPSSCLATGSEDGTVRLWDARLGTGGGPGGPGRCVRVLDSAAGREVAGGGGGAEVLQCLRNPPVTCLRFESSGSWLLCGQGGNCAAGGSIGSLSLWNLSMAQRARQLSTSFVPQAMVVQPAELLVVGSEPALSRYSLALEGPTQQPLTTRSVFALDVHPLTGAVAVGGVGAYLELLSKYGKRTGGVAFVSDED